MSYAVAVGVSCILFVIALVHAYWAFGGSWPASERAELPRTVVGTEDSGMPPQGITLVVACLIAVAACVPLIWVRLLPSPVPSSLVALALWGLVLIFLSRGLITYTGFAARYSTVEPFVGLNRRYYSPLCLILGIGLMFVACFG